MELWHGSREIVRHPSLDFCRPNNDYGSAFYCTPSEHMAKEWACPTDENGFANRYELDLADLVVLNLQANQYSILNWLTVLVMHRSFEPRSAIATTGMAYLVEHFSLDLNEYDVICGYRADDSYFSFARAFLNNTLSVSQLAEAMYLGELGTQYALRTQKALDRLHFIEAEQAFADIYSPLRAKRDHAARANFQRMSALPDLDGLFMRDILQKQIMPGDPRLRAAEKDISTENDASTAGNRSAKVPAETIRETSPRTSDGR